MMMETMKFLGAAALSDKVRCQPAAAVQTLCALQVFGAGNSRVLDMCFDPTRNLLFMLVENQAGCVLEGFKIPDDHSGGLIAFCTKRAYEMERWVQNIPGMNSDDVSCLDHPLLPRC